jgi:hypothetical protein
VKSVSSKKKPSKRKKTSGPNDSANIQRAKNIGTDIDALIQLQDNPNPDVTKNLACNPSLPSQNRFLMTKKYLSLPNKRVSLNAKFDFIRSINKQDFDQNQVDLIKGVEDQTQRELTRLFTLNYRPKSIGIKNLLQNNYDETVNSVSILKISIPHTFSKKLLKIWYSTLVYMVYLERRNSPVQDPDQIKVNENWIKEITSENAFLDISKIKYETFLKLQHPVFQQVLFLLLLGQDDGKVKHLLQSVTEIAPIYIARKNAHDSELREKRRADEERIAKLVEQQAIERDLKAQSQALENFEQFKIQVAKELRPSIFIGSRDLDGIEDNGFSWGVLEKNIYAQYILRITSKVNNYYFDRGIQSRVKGLLQTDLVHRGFKDFIQSLNCGIYRGNLRIYSPFPVELFESVKHTLERAALRYYKWCRTYSKSVLEADRGNIPEGIKPLLSGWTTVAPYFDEGQIFFLNCLGFICSYDDFQLGFHVAFVAAKTETNGLRGQWILTLTGLPEKFHRDIQVMGWNDLGKSKYKDQVKFKDLLASGETFWFLESDSASFAKSAMGKLIEGLLYERHKLTVLQSSSFLREVSSDIRVQRRKVLDLIYKIRRYRTAMRYRPYLGYCANPSCGLPLSDPQSLARGYGPTCWEKMYKEGVRHRDLTTDYDRLYFETPVSLNAWQDSLAIFFNELLTT